jgi:hypothetical protein
MIKEKEVDRFFNQKVEDSQFSAAILVAYRNCIVLNFAYGQSNDDDNLTKTDLPATKTCAKLTHELFA